VYRGYTKCIHAQTIQALTSSYICQHSLIGVNSQYILFLMNENACRITYQALQADKTHFQS